MNKNPVRTSNPDRVPSGAAESHSTGSFKPAVDNFHARASCGMTGIVRPSFSERHVFKR